MPNVEPYYFYCETFIELSSCRGGMGDGPIPFTSIVEYFKIYEDELEDFDEFLYLIRLMDKKLLESISKKKESKDKDSK